MKFFAVTLVLLFSSISFAEPCLSVDKAMAKAAVGMAAYSEVDEAILCQLEENSLLKVKYFCSMRINSLSNIFKAKTALFQVGEVSLVEVDQARANLSTAEEECESL